jgi:hypothetical protein
MTKNSILAQAVLVLVVVCGVQSEGHSIPPPPIAADQTRLSRIHDGGVRGDRTVIPDIVATLEYPCSVPREVAGGNFNPLSQADPFYTEIALRAAIRLHAIEALPEIDRLIAVNDPDVSTFARVARARILAEDAMGSVSDTRRRAARQISSFYGELGLTPADLNSALRLYKKPLLNAAGRQVLQVGAVRLVSVGVYAIREVADMVYSGDSRNYLALADVTSLDFKDDTPSAIKLQFARPTRAARAAALVEGLSYWQPGVQYDARSRYIKRLAVDEGPSAAQAAINKLQKMEASPRSYPENSFYDLIDVVSDAGDKKQGARLEKFHDARRQVASRLQTAIRGLKTGHRRALSRVD